MSHVSGGRVPNARWRSASWVNGLLIVGKRAWISAGLAWTIDAADDGQRASPDDHREKAPKPGQESTSTGSGINMIEFWEDGDQIVRDVDQP